MRLWDLIDSYIERNLIAVPLIVLTVGLVVSWLAGTGQIEIYYLIPGILSVGFPAYLIFRKFVKK